MYRKKRADILQMYRTVTEIDKLDKENIVKMDLCEGTREHRYKLHRDRATTREERNTFKFLGRERLDHAVKPHGQCRKLNSV